MLFGEAHPSSLGISLGLGAGSEGYLFCQYRLELSLDFILYLDGGDQNEIGTLGNGLILGRSPLQRFIGELGFCFCNGCGIVFVFVMLVLVSVA